MKTRIFQGLVFGLIALLITTTVFGQTSKAQAAKPPLKLDAPSAILVDADTGKILYEKKADKTRSPASMTKMMSEYLILDAIEKDKISWDSKVKINDYMYKLSQDNGLSGVPLKKDVRYTVKELYKAMAVSSANAATVALARKVAGSEKKFVKRMNKKAKQFGLKKTHFVNSTGLNNSDLDGQQPFGGPHEESKMSARETAKLAYRLIKDHPEALKYSSIKHAKFKKGVDQPIKMDVWNHMLPGLIHGYKGTDGLKTGHTEKAGFNFTGTVKQHGRRLISVVMKTDSEKARFDQTKKLFDYGFDHFKKVKVLDPGFAPKNQKQLSVDKGKDKHVSIQTNKPIYRVIQTGTKDQYKPKVHLEDKQLKAPVKADHQVGTVTMTHTGKGSDPGYLTKKAASHETVPLQTADKVEKANWFSLALAGIGHFFSGIWTSASDMVKGWF